MTKDYYYYFFENCEVIIQFDCELPMHMTKYNMCPIAIYLFYFLKKTRLPSDVMRSFLEFDINTIFYIIFYHNIV